MSVRVAILGTGWGARVQVPVFRQAGLEITALWGRTSEKARAVATQLEIPFSTSEPGEILDRDDVDLVSITTPPHTHCSLSLGALENGKHVLCEKPTALDTGEAKQMAAAAATRPTQLSLIDHELRFLPTRQTLRRLLRDGYVGEVFHVEATFLGGFRIAPREPWNWWSEAEKGGGALGAIGSHMVDGMSWLLGRRIEVVSAALSTFIKERQDPSATLHPVTSDDYGAVTVRFEDGVVGTLRMSAAVAGPGVHRLLVAGSEGSLLAENENLTGFRPHGRAEDLTVRDTLELPPRLRDSEWTRGTLHMARALRAALEDGDRQALKPAATFDDGLCVQRVLDAARQSDKEGGWVEV